MKREYSSEELLHKAASYCSLSEHCMQEVDDKLTNWGALDIDKKKILDRLIKEGFINENRYAQAYVKDKFRFNKWGRIKIAMGLKAKRVDKTVAQDAIDSIDEDDYEETLVELLRAKLKSIKYQSEYEKEGKLFQFAQSRGFEYNVIERASKRI